MPGLLPLGKGKTMGQEINTTTFTPEDEARYHQKLREETKILKRHFDQKNFSKDIKCGMELEAWLVTKDFVPAPMSDKYIQELKHDMVVPEISKFNFELNSDPYNLVGNVFSTLEGETFGLWKRCEEFAESMGLKALTIGTLPTLRDHMLTMDNLSPENRYLAMNNRVMELRGGESIKLKIEGKDSIEIEHNDLITECAATSLQIHFGVTQETAPKYFNSSVVASAFMAATCANSPFFYGKELWDESRVAVFEQSVNVKSYRKASGEYAKRVSMGNGYVHDSVLELFLENLDGYPVLLPETMESDPEKLEHLKLQNGTIWRWNRPIVGTFDDGPGLRLEFRVPSSGPTVRDAMGNMVLQIALVEYLFQIADLEQKISFKQAEANFYEACKKGFDADIVWIDGKTYNIQSLLLNEVLPECKKILLRFGIEQSEIDKYLGDVIIPRVKSGQNGANWQKAFVHTHGARFQEMLEVYYKYQKENQPVHTWHV